jgi:DNA repair protein RadC
MAKKRRKNRKQRRREQSAPNTGPHKGTVLRVEVVRDRVASYVPTGFARAEDVYRKMRNYFMHLPQEEFWALLLDVKNVVIGATMVSRGILDASLVHPREVFAPAIAAGAASVMVMHNHPSGDPEPSIEDEALTARLVEAGRLLGIPVLDSLVIAERGYVSLAERGEI